MAWIEDWWPAGAILFGAYLLVKGVNVLGLETVVSAELQLSFADNTPPPAPVAGPLPRSPSKLRRS